MAPNNITAESPVLIYLKNYIDLTNNFPNDMARLMSELHQIDIKVALYIKVLDSYREKYKSDLIEEKILKVLGKIEDVLLKLEKESDSKLDVVKAMLEQIDLKSRQLDASYKLATISGNPNHHLHVSNSLQCNNSTNTNNNRLNPIKNENTFSDRNSPVALSKEKDNNNSSASNGKRMKRGNNKNNNNNNINNNSLGQDTNHNDDDDHSSTQVTTSSTKRGNGKRALKTNNKAEKKSKTNNNNIVVEAEEVVENNDSEAEEEEYDPETYDPDEPTYCSCKQVSYGEMICCDNDQCPIEWFHFTCVQLNSKPKGRWYCPECRGERSNIPRK